MRFTYSSAILALGLLPAVLSAYNVRPFKVDLSAGVPHMKELIRNTKLPSYSVLGSSGAGIDLSWLKDRQTEWVKEYDWDKEQAAMNKFNHSTAAIANMTVHFIHQRSSDPKAIPLLLTHGWPGSFYEFHNVIGPLSSPGKDSNVSFHVIVPSLPGFGFSSPAPVNWTIKDTAGLFDTLITKVLRYKSYAAVGGDWGTVITWQIQENHANNARVVLYNGLLPQIAPTVDDLEKNPLFSNQAASLTSPQKDRLNKNSNFMKTGSGYFIEQSTRPATIGLALYDNPIGQLAWMGEKYIGLSDPQFGVSPSTITNSTILTAVSLYYLTKSFETALNIYYQNSNPSSPTFFNSSTNIPMGYAAYPFELQYYPEFFVSKVGNLVYYADHPRGGHFAGLDNPDALTADIRTMMGKWYTE